MAEYSIKPFDSLMFRAAQPGPDGQHVLTIMRIPHQDKLFKYNPAGILPVGIDELDTRSLGPEVEEKYLYVAGATVNGGHQIGIENGKGSLLLPEGFKLPEKFVFPEAIDLTEGVELAVDVTKFTAILNKRSQTNGVPDLPRVRKKSRHSATYNVWDGSAASIRT